MDPISPVIETVTARGCGLSVPPLASASARADSHCDLDSDCSTACSDNSFPDVYVAKVPQADNTGYLSVSAVRQLETAPLISQPMNRGYSGEEGADGVYEDRKNEYFTLKRGIFLCFGVPRAPALSSSAQRCSTCFAIPFYILLSMWGIVIGGIAIAEDNFIWARKCPDILAAKVLTVMTGVLFICLGLYWPALYCWAHSKTKRQTHNRNFSTMTLLWWLLCMWLAALTAALGVEVYEHSDILLYLGGPDRKTYLHCPSPTPFPPPSALSSVAAPDHDSDPDILRVPTNTLPVWALGSLVLLILVYLCVFVVNTVTLRSRRSEVRFHL